MTVSVLSSANVFSVLTVTALCNKVSIPINLELIASPDIDICVPLLLATISTYESAVDIQLGPRGHI
jgi:hypothetical protein